MKVERTFWCEGPDCERHVRTASRWPSCGWIFVKYMEPGGVYKLSFCTWDCVLRYAGQFEPSEVIPWGPPAEESA